MLASPAGARLPSGRRLATSARSASSDVTEAAFAVYANARPSLATESRWIEAVAGLSAPKG